MQRLAVAVVSLVLSSASLLAQTPPPSPAAETAPAFTAEESYAFACCQRVATAWRQGEAVDLRDWAPMPGYCGMATAWPAAGSLQFDETAMLSAACKQFGRSRSLLPPGEVLWYAVPEQIGGTGRRVFCVRGDGTLAYSDNSAGTAMNGGRLPEPMDAFGEGAKDDLGAFPRTPGRGRDGNTWMPAERLEQTTARVTLVDEDGMPHADTVITAVPSDSPASTIDVAIPAGVGRTLQEGDATWTGVPAKGLALEMWVQRGAKLRVAASAVTVTGSSLRVVVERRELQRLRWGMNESAAIATLKNIVSGQAQCQAAAAIDVNENDAGESGTFAELAGRVPVRGGNAPMSPPVLSVAFGSVEDGIVVRSGYCFRMFLPGKDGAPVAELDNGGPDAAAIDAALAEVVWCVYAWPVVPGRSGQRAFFVDQAGDVLEAGNDDNRYAGKAKVPAANAARAAGSDGKLTAAGAVNRKGLDGQIWRVVH